MPADDVTYRVRGGFTDAELTELHGRAFGDGDRRADGIVIPWNNRLALSIAWVTARQGGELLGFVNVIGDGGAHAVLLDTCVAPQAQGRGVGKRLVHEAADEARRLGCTWLHADYEPHLVRFYEQACGMRPTHAGLLRLTGSGAQAQ
ncbi:GNAT family N-acetyltransferase [Georgenia halophila]|uniref:GNAT family N-acetyltransferase n=1 Tax=Georgenia halophila TaxID=620889 RepID=A0ABP8LBR0_9MICO